MENSKKVSEKRSKKEKRLNTTNGITIISLVVTIIVLIILAGVSINLILGDNGIITKAKQAEKAQIIAEAKEKIATDILSAEMEAVTRNEQLEKSQIEDIISKYGELQEDGDTIILNKNNYTLSLKDVYSGTTTNTGSYTELSEKIETLQQKYEELKEKYDQLVENSENYIEPYTYFSKISRTDSNNSPRTITITIPEQFRSKTSTISLCLSVSNYATQCYCNVVQKTGVTVLKNDTANASSGNNSYLYAFNRVIKIDQNVESIEITIKIFADSVLQYTIF